MAFTAQEWAMSEIIKKCMNGEPIETKSELDKAAFLACLNQELIDGYQYMSDENGTMRVYPTEPRVTLHGIEFYKRFPRE